MHRKNTGRNYRRSERWKQMGKQNPETATKRNSILYGGHPIVAGEKEKTTNEEIPADSHRLSGSGRSHICQPSPVFDMTREEMDKMNCMLI